MTTTRQTATRGAVRDRTPGPIEEAIIDLTLRGYTPVQIAGVLPGEVRKIAKREGWKSSKVPHLRTIQRIARRVKPSDQSGLWRIDDSAPAAARHVLDFLALAITESEGRVTTVTRMEAEWIARFREVGPPMSFEQTARLLSVYGDRRERETTTADIDAFIAFAPWRSRRAAALYMTAVVRGQVPLAPAWLAETVPMGEWLGIEFHQMAFPQSQSETTFSPPPPLPAFPFPPVGGLREHLEQQLKEALDD